jgi:hypothetical protein
LLKLSINKLQVARHINGLNDTIQDRLMIQKIWSIGQAQTLALKAERLIRTRKKTKNPYPYRMLSES